MPLGDLTSRLTFDGSGFESGANRAKAKVSELDRAFNQVGSSLKSGFLSYFSLQAGVRLFKGLAEDVNTIQSLANKFKITTDEVQILQAEAAATGKTFDELVDSGQRLATALGEAKKAGHEVLFDAQTVKDIKAADTFVDKAIGQGKALFGVAGSGMESGARGMVSGEHPLGRLGAMAQFITSPLVALSQRMASILGIKRLAQRAPLEETAPKDLMSNGPMLDAHIKAFLKQKSTTRAGSLLDESVKGSLNIESDALRSVGNFLGSSTDTVQVWREINQKMDRIVAAADRQTTGGNPFPV